MHLDSYLSKEMKAYPFGLPIMDIIKVTLETISLNLVRLTHMCMVQ
jgi:hypothetical protein